MDGHQLVDQALRIDAFGTVNAIDCRSENTLCVGELGNFRVQKLTIR